MNKKTVLLATMLIIFSIVMSIPFIFAQTGPWYSAKVNAYGTNLQEGTYGGASLEFTVATPPAGSNITNTISGIDEPTEQNYSTTLMPGNNIIITYANMLVDRISLEPGPDPDHYMIIYEGEANWLYVNGAQVPEFSPILIAPMFIVVTLLALIYRRKHKT